MRFTLPTVDIDLLTTLYDAIGIAAAHIEENWEEDDWAGVLHDLTTLGDAFIVQIEYAHLGVKAGIKPLSGVFMTAQGKPANDEAIAAWKKAHPYVRPEIKGKTENSDTPTGETSK